MPAAQLCPDCGKKVRSEYHLCQPSAVEKKERVEQWETERAEGSD